MPCLQAEVVTEHLRLQLVERPAIARPQVFDRDRRGPSWRYGM